MKWKRLLINILISLGVGFLSFLLTKNNQNIYDYINVPDFAPPGFLFPIVWTILYILMGISSFLILDSNDSRTFDAMKVYALQLFFNFFWSIIFFNLKNFVFAFIWIIILLVLIGIMIYKFFKINKMAAYLNVSYFLWVLFAAILNFSIVLLN